MVARASASLATPIREIGGLDGCRTGQKLLESIVLDRSNILFYRALFCRLRVSCREDYREREWVFPCRIFLRWP